MPFKSVIRACCLVGALLFCSAIAAERKAPLIGATREEVLARFGEPKSNIVAGNREVLFFAGERVVLRNNRVIEADEIQPEPPPAPKPVAPPPAATAAPTDSVDATNNAPAPQAPAAAEPSSPIAGPTATTDSSVTPVPVPPPPPEVVIKSVRPPSAHAIPSAAQAAAPSPAPTAGATAASTPSPDAPAAKKPVTDASATPVAATLEPAAAAPQPNAPSTTAAAPAEAPAAPVAALAENPAATTTTSSLEPAAAPEPPSSAAATVTPPAVETPKPAAAPAANPAPAKAPHAEPAIPSATESIFTARTYVLAVIIVGAGIAFLIWRRRQRSLLLEATAVSQHPFAPDVPAAATGARFTLDLLTKLEWKRFEDLVASYYNKTGVVATRTKTGPASPVHIRISWKGEQRPFACVQCIPRPAGLVEAAQVQSLCEVLAAEDIRRGYVVTTGKFGVPARDLAEEKHITLLGGDIFIEKLNALPDAARAELMKDATTGDYTTPSCPACETKMARSATDGGVWQCPACSAVLPRA